MQSSIVNELLMEIVFIFSLILTEKDLLQSPPFDLLYDVYHKF